MLDSLRNRGFDIDAIEKFGHDPKYPVTDNWPHLVEQLADFARERVKRAGGPVFLVGHSLGGVVAIRAAVQRPDEPLSATEFVQSRRPIRPLRQRLQKHLAFLRRVANFARIHESPPSELHRTASYQRGSIHER